MKMEYDYEPEEEETSAPEDKNNEEKQPRKIKFEPIPFGGINTTDQESAIIEHIWERLVKLNEPDPTIFRNNEDQCVVLNGEVPKIITESNNRSLFERMLIEKFIWVKHSSKGKIINSKMPRDLVRPALAVIPERIPLLENVVSDPVVAGNGKIVSTPGYDVDSQVFVKNHNITIPTNTTREDANAALCWILDEVFSDFPFENGQTSMLTLLGALLTPLIRPWIQGPVPMILIDASVQGSGKSRIASIIQEIAGGIRGAINYGGQQSEPERLKQITTALIKMPATVIIDNVKTKVDSASLAAVLTGEYHQDRVLGSSTEIRIKNNALWIMTLNNAELDKDFTRRCLRIRLNPTDERPHLRTGFKHPDLMGWVKEHRTLILNKLWIAVSSWVEAGAPLREDSLLGSYEDFSRKIGGLLSYCGMSDFLHNYEQIESETDLESYYFKSLIVEMARIYDAETLARFEAKTLYNMYLSKSAYHTLDIDSPRSMGIMLSRRIGQNLGGWILKKAENRTENSSNLYCLIKAN